MFRGQIGRVRAGFWIIGAFTQTVGENSQTVREISQVIGENQPEDRWV